MNVPDQSVPAVGQGIIGIECRDDDRSTVERVRALNDADSWQCIEAERSFALRLQGSCQSPIAGYAQLEGGELSLHGVVGSPNGREVYRGSQRGPSCDAKRIGTELADRLLDAGARQLLATLRAEHP